MRARPWRRRRRRPSLSVAAVAAVCAWATRVAPASADVLSPELDLESSTPAPIARSRRAYGHESAVSEGAGAYVLWEELRLRSAPVQLFAAELDPAGVLGPPVALAADADAWSWRPAVTAADGVRAYAWIHGLGADASLVLQRTLDDGSAPGPPVVVRQVHTFGGPALACRAGTCLVAWPEVDGYTLQTAVMAARVDPGGVVLDPGGILVSTGYAMQVGVSAAPTDDGWLLAWGDCALSAAPCGSSGGDAEPRVHLARIDDAGGVREPRELPPADGAEADSAPVLAAGAGATLLAWQSRTGTTQVIRAARIWADGAIVPTEPSVIGGEGAWAQLPRVALGGAGWVVAWSESARALDPPYRVRARGVGADGAAIDSAPQTVNGIGELLSLAGLPGGALAVGATAGPPAMERPLRAVRWEPGSGVAAGPIDLAPSAPDRRVLAMAAGGGERVVAISDELAGLVLERLDPAGVPLGSVTAAVQPPWPDAGDVLFDGARFLVVAVTRAPGPQGTTWGSGAPRLFRLDPDGTLLEPAGTPLPAPHPGFTSADCFTGTEVIGNPRLGRTARGSFVTYEMHYSCHGEWGEYDYDADFAFTSSLDADGLPTTARPDPGGATAVAGDGTTALALYTASWGVGGVLFDGTTTIPTGPLGLDTALDAAFGGDRYLAVGTLGDELAGVLLSTSGSPLQPLVTLGDFPMTWEGEARAVWDGTDFVVAWSTDLQLDVLARRILADGSTGPIVEVSHRPFDDAHPRLASSGDGTVLIAYDRSDPVAPYRAQRARVRLLGVGPAPLGWVCSAGAECDSGFCVDGVCCDTECGGGAPDDCRVCARDRGAGADGACAFVAPGVICRPAAGPCDVAERCDAASAGCPVDLGRAEGSLCDPDGFCSLPGACAAGACVPGADVSCPQPFDCLASTCGEAGCDAAPVANGTPCPGGSCAGGDCRPGTPDAPDGGVDAPDGGDDGTPGEPDGGVADAPDDPRDGGAGNEARDGSRAGGAPDDGGCGCGPTGAASGSSGWLLAIGSVLLRRRPGSAKRRAPSAAPPTQARTGAGCG